MDGRLTFGYDLRSAEVCGKTASTKVLLRILLIGSNLKRTDNESVNDNCYSYVRLYKCQVAVGLGTTNSISSVVKCVCGFNIYTYSLIGSTLLRSALGLDWAVLFYFWRLIVSCRRNINHWGSGKSG